MDQRQASRTTIRILGSIEADTPNPLPLGGKTQRRLLAVLLADRGSVVSVDRLIELTWPEAAPEKAAHNVRTYIHRLRSALGDAVQIDTVEPGYRLTLYDASLDAVEFEALLVESRQELANGSVGDALRSCGSALELWGGVPYGEFAYEEWARADVVRLEELHSNARETEAELQLLAGRTSSALSRLESLINEHPLRERPRALKLRALYTAGRQTEALREFQRYRQLLLDEVGVEPSADLADLDRAIARGDRATIEPSGPETGGFQFHEEIGSGAFAVVRRATQVSLGRDVAVKIIRAELANEPSFVRSFETEARAIAKIEHPNVVPLYDFWRDPDRAYLVMRLMTGGSLSDRLAGGALATDDVLSLVDEIADALEAAHSRGLVHRDVKPSNILFDEDGRSYLTDFGIAHDTLDSLDHSVEDGARFAAPEQLTGGETTSAADVYGLASVALASLAGTTLFASSNSLEQLLDDKREGLLTGVARISAIAPSAYAVLARAGSASPSERPGSVLDLAAELREALESGTSATPQRRARIIAPNPYQGLRPFDQTAADVFFGRARLVGELITRLEDRGCLAVVGASGSGKSSVVRAGLIPALHDDGIAGSDRWFTTSMTPGARPFEALETALLRVAVNPPAALLEQLKSPDRGILRSVRRVLPEDDATLAIVIDQFEELFTNVDDPAVTAAFLNGLAQAASEPNTPLRLIITLRADFYDRPLRHPVFAPIIKEATVAITPLAPDELEQVIIAPAHAAGKEFEPGLVAEIMADASSQPGSLPLLQYALMRAFDQSEGQLISHQDYRSVGGILGSLTQRAEEIYTDLSSSDQARTRRIMGQLVALGEGTEDTRRTALRSELGPDSGAALDRFGAARLLTFDNDPASREPTVEVAHEALIREWPRLRVWLEEDRDGMRVERHLIVSAREWDASGRPDSELYRGGRLETAEAWAEIARPSGVPAEYLEASAALRQGEIDAEAARFETQAANNRRLRRSLAGVAVLLVCAMVAGAVAVQQRTNARTAAAEADEARDQALNAAELEQIARSNAEAVATNAETGRLVATAQSLADTNKRAAMLVAVAAHQREQSPSTLGGLQVALSKSGPLLGYLGWGQHYHDAHWLTENRVIGVRSDGADLFNVSTGELLDSIQLEIGGESLGNHPRPRNAANPATDNFVAIDRPTGAIVFRVNDRFEEIGRIESNSELQDVGWKPDGSAIVSTDTDAAVSIWATNGERLFRQDMSDASTFYEQVLELAGPENAQWPGYQAPLESGIPLADENGFWANWGFYLGHFSWNGELDRTLSMWLQLPVGQFPTGVISIATSRDSDGAHFIHPGGPRYISSLSELRDGGRIVVEQNPELSVFDGLPSIQGVLSVADGHVLAIVDDGTIRKIDDPGGAVETLVDVATGSSTGASMNPQDPSQVVMASPTGLVLVSLGDAGPLSRSMPRDGAPTLSITRDGRYAVTGPSGLPGPVTFWHEQAGRFVRHEATPSEPLGWAAADPGYFDVIGAGGPQEGQRILLVEDDSFRTIGQFPIDPSGEGANTGAADPGGTVNTAAKADVRVHDFTSGELLRELPSPDPAGGALAQVSGNVFHPFKPWFLVSTYGGKSQLWSSETWEQIDHPGVAAADILIGHWNADGSLFASASSTGQISIRDGETFKIIRDMVGAAGTGNTFSAGTLRFSNDSTTLLTNFDGPGRLWDVETGQQIGIPFETAPSTNSGINWGETLQLITGTEANALVWNLNMDEWPDIACQTAGSNLTREEWTQWGPQDEEYRAICPQFPLPE